MATTTNFGWTTPDDTDLVKDGAAAIRTLGSSIDTSLVDLKGGTTGQVLTKASNTDLDFSFTTPATNPITTEGDLVIGDASGDAVRLPIGALGTVLTSDGDTADWAAPSFTPTFVGAYAYSTTAQSIGNAYTAIDLVGEAWDTDGFHSTSTNTPRMTIPAGKGGYYLAMFTCNWATGGTATKIIGIAVNGTGGDLLTSFDNQANGLRHNCFRVIDVDAGDYIQAVAYSGDTKNMNNAYLQIIYLGA
jgi:hypothetical protein